MSLFLCSYLIHQTTSPIPIYVFNSLSCFHHVATQNPGHDTTSFFLFIKGQLLFQTLVVLTECQKLVVSTSSCCVVTNEMILLSWIFAL